MVRADVVVTVDHAVEAPTVVQILAEEEKDEAAILGRNVARVTPTVENQQPSLLRAPFRGSDNSFR